MNKTYITDNQRHIADYIENIRRYLEYDSYYLTRDDRDSISHKLDELSEFINDTYMCHMPDGN